MPYRRLRFAASFTVSLIVGVVTLLAACSDSSREETAGLEPNVIVQDILLSTDAERTNPKPLDGTWVAGEVYVFAKADGVSGVNFYLDGADAPYRRERAAPFDLEGSAGAVANPLVTNTLADGLHTVRAELLLTGGATKDVTSSFLVDNGGDWRNRLLVSASPARTGAKPLSGTTLKDNAYIFLVPGQTVRNIAFYLDGELRQTERYPFYDASGTEVDGSSRALDTNSLKDGQHTMRAVITTTSGKQDVSAEFTVANTSQPDPEPDPPSPPDSAKQKGMNFLAYWSGVYADADADERLRQLADTGANWVSIQVFQFQDGVDATTIYKTEQTETEADLKHVIDKARALGLKVMLRPMVDRSEGGFRGEIGQNFSDAQWQAWFSSYKKMVYEYAELAERYGVEQFAVGTELVNASKREAQWREVVAGVRTRYSGPLTYAANHSGEETSVQWWDAVDLIGVDAYYPLTQKTDPTVAELKAGWAPHVKTLETLHKKWGKPIVFTEIGYASGDGTNRQPWAWGGAIADPQEQADAYRATFESLYDKEWFAGMHWWEWFANQRYSGGACDVGHTPQDKPAEDVLRQWYGGAPRPALGTPDFSRTVDIYTDTLASGWEDWSWSHTPNFSSTESYRGSYALSVTLGAWGGLSLHAPTPVDAADYGWLEFYLRGPAEKLGVYATNADNFEMPLCRLGASPYLEKGDATSWRRVRIPLRDMGLKDQSLNNLIVKDTTGEGVTFAIDEMRLIATQ